MTVTRETGSAYSRVTLVGQTRRADLVLPSTEPIGTLFADMLATLGEQYGSARLVLMTATGTLLSPRASLLDANVADGTVLRLVADQSAPPPPVVNDVTEETATDIGARGGRWSPRASRVFATSAAGALAAVLAGQLFVSRAPAHATADGVTLLVAGGAVLLLALGTGWASRAVAVVHGCVAAAVVGAALVAGGAELLAVAHHWVGRDRLAVAIGAGWLGLAVSSVVRRRVGDLAGALLGAALLGAWIGLGHGAVTRTQADALVVAVAAIVCGALPRWALIASGLAALDDHRLLGASVRRDRLRRSLSEAHRTLIASTVAIAVTVALCGVYLALDGRAWSVATAAAAALAIALRSRSFPLAAEGALILSSSSGVAVALSITWAEHSQEQLWPIVVTIAALIAMTATVVVHPPAHVRARLRGIGNRLEACAVVALVPLTVGVFGVFGDLLHTFDR